MTLVLYSLFFDCGESVVAIQLANIDLSDHSSSTLRHNLARIETLVLFVECWRGIKVVEFLLDQFYLYVFWLCDDSDSCSDSPLPESCGSDPFVSWLSLCLVICRNTRKIGDLSWITWFVMDRNRFTFVVPLLLTIDGDIVWLWWLWR